MEMKNRFNWTARDIANMERSLGALNPFIFTIVDMAVTKTDYTNIC